MKIVCSTASCRYSREDEDSSNITFVSLSNDDTAAVWAHNCGRSDLIEKSMQDLRTNHYACSNRIEDQFFISKTNPIIIAQGAVSTIFGTSRHSENDALDSNKDNYEFNNVIDFLLLRGERQSSIGSAYREPVYNNELDAASDINVCDTTANIDETQRISSVRFTNLCRMCGRPTANGIEIFADRGSTIGLKEKIVLHTPVSVDPADTMPQKICSVCCDKLEATHSLVVTCLRTDMRLRRFLNISDKTVYDPKFEALVSSCSMEMEMSNEMNSNNVGDTDELSNNCKQVSEPSNDNAVNSKLVILHSDPKNVFQALKKIGPKNDEINNELSTMILQPVSTEENSRLICLNCNTSFESREIFNSHEMTCNFENIERNVKENTVLDSKAYCTICRLSFSDVEVFEKHKKSCQDSWENSIILNRRCGHCSATFNTRKELQIHTANSHDNRLLFKCSICDKTYGKWSSLDVHEATHRLDKPYLCDLCGKSFKHSNNLRGHKRIHLEESKKKRHICEICGGAFRSRFHLREHTNQHNGNKPYTCDECGKAFYKRIQLRQHRLSHGSNKYACPICGVTFNRRGNMNTHLKRHSKTKGMYTCSVCEYKCKSMSELKFHRKQHSENDVTESIKLKTAEKIVWQCKICHKVFSKRAILLNHEGMHTGNRMRVECDKCGKKLANKSSLKYHNKSIHSTERPHVCQFCSEAFVSKEARLIHERIHTGERPYTCNICSMRYRCSSNLSQHMKIHSSIRPHVCSYCNKTFARKGALNVHERIHTGFKPFVCQICGRSFSQKNDMLKHTKTHQIKSTQYEKCDKVLDKKIEISKHLDFNEESAIEDSILSEYVEATEPLESYNHDEFID